MAAEAAVATEDDPHPRPGSTEPLHQERQNGPGMLGGVDVGGTQITYQQLVAAEDVQRQKAILVVKAVEEAAFLAAMHRIVGGVEIQNEFRRRRLERGNELFDQKRVQGNRRGAVRPVLEAAQRRRARQRRDPLDRGLQRQVMAKRAMVVQILVAERQCVDTLAELIERAVPAASSIPWIGQQSSGRRHQPEPTICRPQQKHPAIAADIAASEIGHHRPLATPGNAKLP